MSLWLIDIGEDWDYDQFDAFVVRAPNEEMARAIARNEAAGERGTGDYGQDWMGKATCTRIPEEGENEVILGSFQAG